MRPERLTGGVIGMVVACAAVIGLGMTYAPDPPISMVIGWTVVGIVSGFAIGVAVTALLFPDAHG